MKKFFLALCLVSVSAFAGDGEDSARDIAHKRLDLAQTMIRAFDAGHVCEADAYPSEINQLISAAWFNASGAAKQNFLQGVSPDSEMRADMAFRVATEQMSLQTDQTAEAFAASITGAKFYKFGRGAYGSPYNVLLAANGVAQERTLEVLNEEPWFKWHDSSTTWSVRKEKGGQWNSERFVLRIGNNDYVIRQQAGGEIWWQPAQMEDKEDIDYENTLSSTDSYCEA